MIQNTPEKFTLSNQPTGTYPFVLRGGSFWIEFKGTGAGTVDLNRIGPDGVTATARITQIVATVNQQTVVLAPGSYQLVIVGFTANNFEAARVASAIE